MLILDASLRGGAVALLVLLAIAGLRDARRSVADRYSVVFDVCAIAYLVESAPGVAGSGVAGAPAWWLFAARLLSTATPAVFEVWTDANFNDGFVARWWRWLPFVGMAGLAAWGMVSGSAVVWRLAQVAALLLVGVGIYRTLAGWGADLVEGRRRMRLVFAGGLGLWIAATTVLGAMEVRSFPSVTGVLGLALAAALLRLRMARDAPEAVVATGAVPEALDAEERALRRRLLAVMEEERAYREGGLTVGGLAERLGVPEYRLRRLINARLGQRNFVSFANGYRLDEAMAALADPTQARVTVLTIALDCGFQSIGPFNRAFKARTGETPTAFRRSRLGKAG